MTTPVAPAMKYMSVIIEGYTINGQWEYFLDHIKQAVAEWESQNGEIIPPYAEVDLSGNDGVEGWISIGWHRPYTEQELAEISNERDAARQREIEQYKALREKFKDIEV